MPVRTKGNFPVKKVGAAGVAGAATTIIVFILNTYILPETKPLTGEIAAAITTILAFVAAYLTPPGNNEQNIN